MFGGIYLIILVMWMCWCWVVGMLFVCILVCFVRFLLIWFFRVISRLSMMNVFGGRIVSRKFWYCGNGWIF